MSNDQISGICSPKTKQIQSLVIYQSSFTARGQIQQREREIWNNPSWRALYLFHTADIKEHRENLVRLIKQPASLQETVIKQTVVLTLRGIEWSVHGVLVCHCGWCWSSTCMAFHVALTHQQMLQQHHLWTVFYSFVPGSFQRNVFFGVF